MMRQDSHRRAKQCRAAVLLKSCRTIKIFFVAANLGLQQPNRKRASSCTTPRVQHTGQISHLSIKHSCCIRFIRRHNRSSYVLL